MKVLRVITSMNPAHGGPCQGIRNSIPEQGKIGVSNEVVCLDAPDAGFLGNDPFKIHALGQARGPWAYNATLKAWLVENAIRFDIIIIHGIWQYHAFAVTSVLKKLAKTADKTKLPRVYVMPHGMLDPYFQKAEGRKLKAIRNMLYWKAIEKHTVENADGVLFTTEEELYLARTSFRPYHPQKEINIGYGIAMPPGRTAEIDAAFIELCPAVKEKKFILFLSRIHPKKGIDLLINAYLELKKKRYSMPLLVIAGPGLDSEYGSGIKKMAKDDQDILFPGMLTGNAKWGAFYNCEVFALPSHQENFGIAIAEAMACHKAVLTTDKVNIWRDVNDKKAGFVEPDTSSGVSLLLEKWLDQSEDEKKQMSQNAFNLFAGNFFAGAVAEKIKFL
jgi:glycosyltransferase involved in cell wall biosynthesis